MNKLYNMESELLDLLEDCEITLMEDHSASVMGIVQTLNTDRLESDVSSNVNLLVDMLMSYEDLLSEDQREEYEIICQDCLRLDAIKEYTIGELVIVNSLPYILTDIDYDDLTVYILDGGMEYGCWEDVLNIKKQQ